MRARRGLTITGGRWRGLKIEAADGIRPTSGRLREALFSQWGARLAGSRFLDLFAGSGAVGLEAASRGAAFVGLVEGEARVLACLERNLRLAGAADLEVLRARLPAGLPRCLREQAPFDLVFADPPYSFADYLSLLAAVEPHLAVGGELAVEHAWRNVQPVASQDLRAVRSRRYGDSGLTLYRRAG